MNNFGQAGVLLLSALILTACTGPAQQSAQSVETAPLVWPEPPEAARVVHVSSLLSPKDFGITDGPFSILTRILFGEKQLRLVRPMAVVVSNNTVFVADPGAKGVHRFDKASNEHTLILLNGNKPLPSPVGLALGAGGDVYVSDSALGQVLVIHPQSDSASPVPLERPLKQPTGIAFDPERKELFVVDTLAHRIYTFSSKGRLLREFGERGDANGAFNFPTMIWRTGGGEILVTDSLNFRVQSFDGSGKWRMTFGRHGDGTGDLARHKGIATDQHGHIYVVDALFHAIQIFDARGTFLLAVGELGQGPGEFWLPSGIFIDADNTLYVADSYNQRIQVFRYIGGPT